MPSGVSTLPEPNLAVDQLWLTAEEALQRHASHDLQLTAITVKILQLLRPFPHAEGAMSHFLRQQHAAML
jgi:hypothetical protein